MSGRIELIIGPMFAGKSTELIRRLENYTIAARSCVVVKFDKDDRYESGNQQGIITHSHITTNNLRNHPVLRAPNLTVIAQQMQRYDVIGITEGQFFPDLATVANHLAAAGKVVVVDALNATFEAKIWPSVANLIPFCDDITYLRAVCANCRTLSTAIFSHLVVDAGFAEIADFVKIGNTATIDLTDEPKSNIIIGGSEKYRALCRNCKLLKK